MDLEPPVAMEQEAPAIAMQQETPTLAMEQVSPAVAMQQETPALAMDHEPTKQAEAMGTNEVSELQQLADAQQASDEISGIMAGFSANPPPVDPVNTTGFTIRGNQPQNP